MKRRQILKWVRRAAVVVLVGAGMGVGMSLRGETNQSALPEATGTQTGAEAGVEADAITETGDGNAEGTPSNEAVSKKVPVDNGNPYQAIVVRNAFRLKDPLPPPPPPTNAPPVAEQPKVDVKLAGLARIKGVAYAYLMVPDTDRPGQFQYPTLTDNPDRGRVRHGSGLEVREINMKAQTVRLVNGGVEATINFKDHGVKAAPVVAPSKPGAPATTTAANLRPPTPTGGAAPHAGGASSASAEPIVFSRYANRASQGNNANGGSGVPVSAAGVPLSVLAQPSGGAGSDVVVPTRPVRTSGAGVNAQTPQQPQITLEQEYQALIRQRQVADQQGIQLPPIPGLPLPTDPNPTP